MSRLDEAISAQFDRWEVQGRGWRVHTLPVTPEPPFRPFCGYRLPQLADDGRKPTFLSALVERWSNALSSPKAESVPDENNDTPQPTPLIREELCEFQTTLPAQLDIPRETFLHFLQNLALCREPVAFELLGTPHRINTQFAAHRADAAHLERQLGAYFPDAVFLRERGALAKAWEEAEAETAIVEFGLGREFVLPLATGKLDPFVGIIGALSDLQPGELALFQVLFQPAHHPWAESFFEAVTLTDGKPLFVNRPELAKAAMEKAAQPLFAAVVRLAARAREFDQAWAIARDLAATLRVFASPGGNELIPLVNDGYQPRLHEEDVCRRQSHRSGMILTLGELAGFVHLPSPAVRSVKLQRIVRKSKAAVSSPTGLLLGENSHAGVTCDVRLSPEQRARHLHLIGASGTGKSTLLFNLIRQDVESGEGLAVLDPHGDLIDRILGIIPERRVGDVVLIDPSDETASIGFNILSAHSDLEKNLLASDLVSVFRRLSTSWGDQMGSVLQNAVLAFLESEQGGTLADLRRFLLEPVFREKFLTSIRDQEILYYWRKGFPQLGGNRSIGPILTRLDTFLAPKPIRYMVSQRENRLDFARMLDEGKIVLAKLSQGQLGRENAFLLGSLLVVKFQQLAMGRQAQRAEERRPFHLYIDEFQNFITPSMAEILSGARKYRLGLILAHQELRQLERDREVASAVLSNCGTRVVFRVGDEDARKLAEGFASFESRDLQTLETGQAICRIERADNDCNLTVSRPEEPDPSVCQARREAVVATSRQAYATPRAELEALFQSKPEPEPVAPAPVTPLPIPKTAEGKDAGVRKPTSSEKETPRAELPVIIEPGPPADLGRGGEQHKAIQRQLKAAAEELGFRAIIEKPVLDGQGSVDVALEREGERIAVEITITTTVEHEVGNVRKCLEAGFARVILVSPKSERLQAVARVLQTTFSAEQMRKVTCGTPEECIALLRSLAPLKPPAPAPPAEKKVRGYRVRVSGPELTPAERQAKEEAAIRLMAQAMKPQ
jgi:hypothetical protein